MPTKSPTRWPKPFALLIACALSLNVHAQPWEHAAVAADHELASQAGVEILQQGGNVVDATVATGFALSVLRPGSAGLGGGGFMVIWNAEKGEAVALDFRERAPEKATRDLFTKPRSDGTIPSSEHGGSAIAVPGQVAGLCHALTHYGTMTLAQVLAPALRYAEEGVPLDRHEIDGRTALAKNFAQDTGLQTRYAILWEQYLLKGAIDPTTRYPSPQAPALRALAELGPAAFYEGAIAQALVACIQTHDGILSTADLATMDVVPRTPITTQISGSQVFSFPPPSSGGIALEETFNILNAFIFCQTGAPLRSLGHNSPEYLHLLTESMKYAFADRGTYLGDADFHEVPVARLTSSAHAEKIAAHLDIRNTQPPEHYGAAMAPNDAGTTHYSVIDKAGNAVACTETINTAFGSWVVEPQYPATSPSPA